MPSVREENHASSVGFFYIKDSLYLIMQFILCTLNYKINAALILRFDSSVSNSQQYDLSSRIHAHENILSNLYMYCVPHKNVNRIAWT